MTFIDRDLLLKDIDESIRLTVKGSTTSPANYEEQERLLTELRGAKIIIDRIELAPVADVAAVVRCENCKHAWFQYNNNKYPFGVFSCKKQPAGRAYKKVRGDFFCAYGELRDKYRFYGGKAE